MTSQEAYDLAMGHAAVGRYAEAEEYYRLILSNLPEHSETLYGLGTLMLEAGRVAEAADFLKQATTARPGEAPFWHGLGVALARLSRMEEAVAALSRAVEIREDFAEAHQSLGNVWLARSDNGRAIDAYGRALELRPGTPEVVCGLVNALINAGDLEQGIAVCRDGLKLHPDRPELARMLVRALRESGRLDEAIDDCRQALAARPNSQLHGDLLFTLHFHPGYGRRALREEHRKWYETHAKPLAAQITPHENPGAPGPERRLRIGYFAHHLGNHALGRFFLPLLEHHDRRAVEVYCYCDTLRVSQFSRRFREAADVWRDIELLSDEQAASLVRQDRIDVLIDLTMHTDGNRLLMFARKPAPVQVTYLAYCSTTGLETIDYRLTDSFLDPASSEDSDYAEESVWLPGCYWCYIEPEPAPAVGPLPALANGFLTFGCLNDFAKISADALSLWCRLLREAPGSKLALHSKVGSHRQRAIDHLQREGIDPARLQLVPFQALAAYYATYNQIDIGLDPFPWAGGTTTCDALWMGVPVVTLPGEVAVSRGGLSILSNVGLPEWVAKSADDYLAIASGLARDLPRLANLRSTLRRRMRESPVMDAPSFARGVEGAYREMWRRWCESR